MTGKLLTRRSAMFMAGAALGSTRALAQSMGGGTLPANIVLVGTSLTLAPFSFINEKGESVGFELDIIQAVAERLGLKVSYVRVPFSQNFTSLNAGIFRIGAASAFMTCPRLADPKGVGRFSVPTYSSGQAISTKASLAPKIKGFADLAGMKVGVESVGSTADKLVDNALKMTTFEKVVFPDNPSLFLALEQGRIQAAIQSEFPSLWQTRGIPDIKVAARLKDTYIPVGYVFRDGDPLRDDVNRVLDELKTEGVLAALYKKWFQVEPDPESPTVKVVPTVTAQSRACA